MIVLKIKNTIFKNKEQEYIEVKKLDAKKWELAKLKRLFDIEPYTIEFTGTPRTGKTTLINNLYDFFKKGKFKTGVQCSPVLAYRKALLLKSLYYN